MYQVLPIHPLTSFLYTVILPQWLGYDACSRFSHLIPTVSSAWNIFSPTLNIMSSKGHRLNGMFIKMISASHSTVDIFVMIGCLTPPGIKCSEDRDVPLWLTLKVSWSDTCHAPCICPTGSIFMAGTCLLPVAHGSWDDILIWTLNSPPQLCLLWRWIDGELQLVQLFRFQAVTLIAIVLEPWDITSN